VTGCAMEGLDGPVRLKPTPLKTYLNACAQLAEIATSAPERPIPMLIEVTKASPRFGPAWAKLLLAEAEMVAYHEADTIADLRRHIAEARTLDPAMPEAAIAEALLLPARDFAGRAKRIEQAAAQSPDNPRVLVYLADTLAETGRTREAVDAAARAAQLDPLSPSIHADFTAMLAYAGAFDAAKRELAKAEKLWPGTASLWDSQYRFHLRYGDPRIARAIFEQQADSSGGKAIRMYLETRQDPTPAKVDRFLSYVSERLRNMSDPSAGFGFAILAYGHFGRNEEIFSTLLSWPNLDDVANISDVLFRPEFRDARRDLRILRVFQRTGLLDYWRVSGKWPDFCFDADKAYDCKAEAAKLAT
ncbi:MAG: tetratricopeptide repeat protein, partial [Gammaproteobacteria bacterium]